MKTIYSMPAPWMLDALVEVYGEPEMAYYEWRILHRETVIHDTKNAMYGNAEIALRDALNYATKDF